MKPFTCPVLFALLVACSLGSALAHADGKLFVWRNEDIDIHQPSQKAILHWDGATERLILQTKYTGPPEDMVWIVPVPSEPTVKEATALVFEEYSRATQEIEFLCTRFASAKQTLGAAEEAPLQWERRVGAYEVALLKPTSQDNVLAWLRTNEYAVDQADESVLRDYIDHGWWIVASRIHRDALTPDVTDGLANGTIHPIEIAFRTERPVYPMRLTGLSGVPLELLLWIEGDKHVEPVPRAGWAIEFHGGPRRHWYGRHEKEDVWWQLLQNGPDVRWTIEPSVTKLRRTFQPDEMNRDIYFEPADYADYFDFENPVFIGMIASQFGRRRDPEGIPLLTQALNGLPLVDEPHLRSSVWALGEIGREQELGDAAHDAILRCADSKPMSVRMEAYIALAKMGDIDAVSGRALRRLPALVKGDFRSRDAQSYMMEFERNASAQWLDSRATGTTRDQYILFMNEFIQNTSADPRSSRTHRTLNERAEWALRRALALQSPILLDPILQLRKAAALAPDDKEQLHFTLVEAACGSHAAIQAITDELVAEGQKSLPVSVPKEARYIVSQIRNRIAPDENRYAPDSLDGVNHRDSLANAAYDVMPAPRRDDLARRALAATPANDLQSLFLLSWLSAPDEADKQRLLQFWQKYKNTPEWDKLVVDVAYRWKDLGILHKLLEYASNDEVRDEVLWALAVLCDPMARDVFATEIRTRWNEAFQANGDYGESIHTQLTGASGLNGFRAPEAILHYTDRVNPSPNHPTLLDELSIDASLCPQLQYNLLSYSSRGSDTFAPAASELFDRITATPTSPEVYTRLLYLLGQARATDKLLRLREEADDPAIRDAALTALMLTDDERLLAILDHALRNEWCDRFQASTAFSLDFSKLHRLFKLRHRAVDTIRTFLADEQVNPDYRAFVATQLDDFALWQDFRPNVEALLQNEALTTQKDFLRNKYNKLQTQFDNPGTK